MKVTVVAKNRKGMEVTYDAEGLLAQMCIRDRDNRKEPRLMGRGEEI